MTKFLFAAALFFVCLPLRAEVSVLGWTIGQQSLASVQADWPSAQQTGINRYSNGPMLEGSGQGFGVTGLQEVLAIFDAENRLAAVLLTFENRNKMRNNRFDALHRLLSGKYAVRETRMPFVDDKYARYGAPGITIELNAPHMSFEATALYQTDTFRAAFRKAQRDDAQRERQREANQL